MAQLAGEAPLLGQDHPLGAQDALPEDREDLGLAAQQPGVLLAGDILQVTPGKDAVSFMWSYPNMLPLPGRTVAEMTDRLRDVAFARLYGAFEGQDIQANADDIVKRSGQKYIACLK